MANLLDVLEVLLRDGEDCRVVADTLAIKGKFYAKLRSRIKGTMNHEPDSIIAWNRKHKFPKYIDYAYIWQAILDYDQVRYVRDGQVDRVDCEIFIEHNALRCFEYGIKNKYIDAEYFVGIAINHDNAECLKIVYANRCECKAHHFEMVVRRGCINCLRFLHENYKSVFIRGSIKGENATIQCFKDCGIENMYNYVLCSWAAMYGHLNCLQFLHENGYKWREIVYINALNNKKLDCFKYAFENGCPWNTSTQNETMLNARKRCIKYALDHGCRSWKPNASFDALNPEKMLADALIT